MDQGTNSTTFIAEDHLDFLQGLAHDESLRAELQANPVETLAKYGIEIDTTALPTVVELPDGAEVGRSLELGPMLDLLREMWFPFLDGDDVN